MADDTRFWRAGLCAEEFLKTRSTPATLPIDPFEIARDKEIVVQAKPAAAEGVSGMLLRNGDTFGILYATHVKSEGFQRFSVAHELGHYLLPGHIDHVLPRDGVHESRAGFVQADLYELEADHFASSLLMPGPLVTQALRRMGDGLTAAEKLAQLCKTSLTAAAIKYAEKATTPVAVIVSTGPRINYCFMSKPLKAFSDLSWLKRNEPLPPRTATQRFNADTDNVADGERSSEETDLRDWFGGARKLPGTEEVIGLGTYGKTLTVLTTDIDEEDEDEDEDLERSWTPRFRR